MQETNIGVLGTLNYSLIQHALIQSIFKCSFFPLMLSHFYFFNFFLRDASALNN